MQTIGERLEEARKKKGVSIREAAEATKIRGDYLQRFETNHFDIGLTEIYTRGFLRTYSNFLKLPADRILNDYAALGRGEVRPRQPNREVYGRMDISVATAEGGERPPAPEPVPEPSPANRGPQRSRAGTSLPAGPDPAVVFRYVKISGLVLIALLVLWIAKSLFFSSRPAVRGSGTTTSTPARGATFGLVASSPVQVTVRRKNPNGSDGEILFAGTVAPGEVKMVPRPGAVYIEASAPDSLMIDINGKRFAMGLPPGERRGELPAP